MKAATINATSKERKKEYQIKTSGGVKGIKILEYLKIHESSQKSRSEEICGSHWFSHLCFFPRYVAFSCSYLQQKKG